MGTKIVSARVDDVLMQRIQDFATEHGVSVSEYVARTLEAGVSRDANHRDEEFRWFAEEIQKMNRAIGRLRASREANG